MGLAVRAQGLQAGSGGRQSMWSPEVEATSKAFGQAKIKIVAFPDRGVPDEPGLRKHRVAVRRGLTVRPVASPDAEPGDPVHPPTARGAVQLQAFEFALQVRLHP